MGSLGILAKRARVYDCNRNILDNESKERALERVMPEAACTLVCFKYTIITLFRKPIRGSPIRYYFDPIV